MNGNGVEPFGDEELYDEDVMNYSDPSAFAGGYSELDYFIQDLPYTNPKETNMSKTASLNNTQQNYLMQRARTIKQNKVTELQKKFGIYMGTPPAKAYTKFATIADQFEAVKKLITEGKVTLTQYANVDRPYNDNSWSGYVRVNWTETPTVKRDQDGYDQALKTLEVKFVGLTDLIMLGGEAEEMRKALAEFEAA